MFNIIWNKAGPSCVLHLQNTEHDRAVSDKLKHDTAESCWHLNTARHGTVTTLLEPLSIVYLCLLPLASQWHWGRNLNTILSCEPNIRPIWSSQALDSHAGGLLFVLCYVSRPTIMSLCPNYELWFEITWCFIDVYYKWNLLHLSLFRGNLNRTGGQDRESE